MGHFNNGGSKRFEGGGNRGGSSFGDRGGRPSFPKKSWDNNRSDNRFENKSREMFKASCSECGKSCEVPFRPSGGKPVFCSDCFRNKEGAQPSFPRNDFKKDFKKSYNDRDSKPRFEQKFEQQKESGDDLKKQIEIVNVKLDRLIRTIETLVNGDITQPSTPVKQKASVVQAVKAESTKPVQTHAVHKKAFEEKKKVIVKKEVPSKVVKAPAKKAVAKAKKK